MAAPTTNKPISAEYLYNQLKSFDSTILENKYGQHEYRIFKEDTATTGYAATYNLYSFAPNAEDFTDKSKGTKIEGSTINIIKDNLLSSVELIQYDKDDPSQAGFPEDLIQGHWYIRFIFLVKDDEGGTTGKKDLFLDVNTIIPNIPTYEGVEGIEINESGEKDNTYEIGIKLADYSGLETFTSKGLKIKLGDENYGLEVEHEGSVLKTKIGGDGLKFGSELEQEINGAIYLNFETENLDFSDWDD